MKVFIPPASPTGPSATMDEARSRVAFQREEAFTLTVDDQAIARRMPVWLRIANTREDRYALAQMRNRMSRQRAGLRVAPLAQAARS